MSTMQSEHFTKALVTLLDETFDNVQGYYLDPQTSLFETLADITAAEASIPVGGRCATLAAQVKHVAFYLETVERSVRDPSYPQVDWTEIWRTVGGVTPDEWQAIQDDLRRAYAGILSLIGSAPDWRNETDIAGAIAIVAHTAYHLGEMRQALCVVRG